MPTPDDFTGERFLPECTGEIWAEHWHRYLFAARHVAGKDVLDAACGEGYGSAWLARHAKSVTGLDIDVPTIASARAKYAAPALRFEVGSVAAMPFANASFDCAVSFETLEHLAEQDAMLAELRRVLRPDGVLIISTPNRLEYTDKRNFRNEFHVHELYEDEFRALLAGHFGAQRWYGQKLVFNSALWPLPASTGGGLHGEWIAVNAADQQMPPAMYFVALAAAAEALLPPMTTVTLLADPTEAMYREFMLTVTRTGTLERLVDEREKLVVERDRQLTLHDSWIQHLEALIAERDRQLSALAARERLIDERDRQLAAANNLIAERERLIAERDGQLVRANDRLAKFERLLADRERIIVERDGQLAAVNNRLASAEVLIAERERIIVERDGQLAALTRRISTLEQRLLDRDRQLTQQAEHVAALEKTGQDLRGEVARRAGWRWWLYLPFLRIRRMLSPTADASNRSGP
jgi:SAM-dependent methyltransferase